MEEKYPSRDIRHIIEELRNGCCTRELSDALQEVVAAAVKTGKSGSLTLTLTVVPEGSQALVKDDIKTKVPKLSTQPTIMFIDDDANLTRRHPKQMRLDDAITPPSADREGIVIDPKTGEVIRTTKQ
jgi:hypothetical protein